MTPGRLSEILRTLYWSDSQTADTLGVRRTTVRAWWRDGQRIPDEIAAALEEIVAVVAIIYLTDTRREREMSASWRDALWPLCLTLLGLIIS